MQHVAEAALIGCFQIAPVRCRAAGFSGGCSGESVTREKADIWLYLHFNSQMEEEYTLHMNYHLSRERRQPRKTAQSSHPVEHRLQYAGAVTGAVNKLMRPRECPGNFLRIFRKWEVVANLASEHQ